MLNNSIPVSTAFLPPSEDLYDYLNQIYASGTVTNNGKLVQELESKLKQLWGVKHLFLVANGTWALQLIYRALALKRGVLTTPFSAIPSLSSLQWEYVPFSFSDIDSSTFNLDASRLPFYQGQYEAISATHVFGNPCNIDTLTEYCEQHDLWLIFDAAHAAGSLWRGKSVLQYGDVSAISFHAFKAFHCIEGGAVVTSDDQIAEAVYRMRYFGLDRNMNLSCTGTNAKNSELHAAVGLSNLKYFDSILAERESTWNEFKGLLDHPALQFQQVQQHGHSNYSYFPVVFQSERILKEVSKALENNGFQTKRYFYPALNTLVQYSAEMPNAEQLANSILCLPHHNKVNSEQRRQMTHIIHSIIDR